MTLNNLQEVITANNGKVSTAVLADMLDKQHTHLTAKLENQLGESVLSNFESTENYEKGLGKVGQRIVYMLPEAEAIALAMSYDMTVGMEVYAAFKAYEAALNKVLLANTLEEAKEVVMSALDTAIAKAIKNNKEGKMVGKQVSKALNECNNPEEMIETLKVISKGMPNVNTGNGRIGYWSQARKLVDTISDKYRRETNSNEYSSAKYEGYEKVSHYCTKRMLQLSKLK